MKLIGLIQYRMGALAQEYLSVLCFAVIGKDDDFSLGLVLRDVIYDCHATTAAQLDV